MKSKDSKVKDLLRLEIAFNVFFFAIFVLFWMSIMADIRAYFNAKEELKAQVADLKKQITDLQKGQQ